MFARLVALLVLALVIWAVAAGSSDGAGPERRYVVKPRDTLWSIAVQHYAGDPRQAVWNLRQRNRLRGTLLHPGQTLVLP